MLRSVYNFLSDTENRATAASWASVDALDHLGNGVSSVAGETVTADTALGVMAYYAGVRMIAEGLGSLPVKAYRETDGAPQPMTNAPEWLDFPNPVLNLTRQDLISQIVTSLLLRGNAYVLVTRSPGIQIAGLEVLDPSIVEPVRQGAQVVYEVNGTRYGSDTIIHYRGLTYPGELKGLDPISYAATTLGSGIAAQNYGATFMENASLPSGYLFVPGSLSEQAATLIRRGWERLNSGRENAGKVPVLTEGTEFRPLSLTPEQTQFMESRKFTVQEVARLLGVPPHLLADSSNSTSWGSGLAEQNTAFSKMTLTPWAKRIETGLTTALRSESLQSRKGHYVRIHLEGFERGAYSDRLSAYETGIAAGIYDPDEVRMWEDLPPMTPAQRKKLKPTPPPVAEPAPTPPTDEPEGGSSDEEDTDS